jgi:hypothetical protein
MTSQENYNELNRLYRTYWSLILSDACIRTGLKPIKENKLRLHESHKKIYGTKSIAGESYEYVSDFITTIVAWYATELGIFLRTSKKMPENIDKLPLSKCWKWL